MDLTKLSFRFISSINEIAESAWDQLWQNDYPFTKHSFFSALETSQSTTKNSGWQVFHLLVFGTGDTGNEELIACIPLFLKSHSYGEYVFDWSWADAYHRAGLDYYPKILNAIPFTPATGPRFAFKNVLSDNEKSDVLHQAISAIQKKALDLGASGFHCLFPQAADANLLDPIKNDGVFVKRDACQFHWFNADYNDFDDFLADCVSRKRKMIRKERKKVSEQGILIETLNGSDVTNEDWKIFYALYHRTYLKRSGRPGYLGETFFSQLAQAMPKNIILAKATLEEKFIAGAVYFRDDNTLYGRYWGTLQDIDGLHFETCYYQGIEYAIKQGLKRFDPGAQGEHKIQRGFIPTKTCSYHWLEHQNFHNAIGEFTEMESKHNQEYMEDANSYLPFKEDARCLG